MAAGSRRPGLPGPRAMPSGSRPPAGQPWPSWRLANPPHLPGRHRSGTARLTVADFTRDEIGSTRSTSNGRAMEFPARSSSSVPISIRYAPGFQGPSPGSWTRPFRRFLMATPPPRRCPSGSRTAIRRRARAWSSGSGNLSASRSWSLPRADGSSRWRGRESSRRGDPRGRLRRTERDSGTPTALGQSLATTRVYDLPCSRTGPTSSLGFSPRLIRPGSNSKVNRVPSVDQSSSSSSRNGSADRRSRTRRAGGCACMPLPGSSAPRSGDRTSAGSRAGASRDG